MSSPSPFPSLSLSAPAPPERSSFESAAAFDRRLAKWKADNATWAGQERALARLEPPPAVAMPRAPWQTTADTYE